MSKSLQHKPANFTNKIKSSHSELNSFKWVLNFSVWLFLSNMCLCSAPDEFDVHYRSLLFLVFNQGEEGTSWYIILKGSVNVVIYGKVRLVIPHGCFTFNRLIRRLMCDNADQLITLKPIIYSACRLCQGSVCANWITAGRCFHKCLCSLLVC